LHYFAVIRSYIIARMFEASSLYSFQTKTRFFTEIQLYISLKILIFIFERVTSQNKIYN